MKFGALVEDGQPVGEAVRVRQPGELLAAIFAQHADGVGTALMAVGHLRHHLPALAADRGEHPGVRLRLAVETKNRAVLRSGNQRHNIVNKRAAFPQTTADLGHAAVVDPRDQHRVYLDQHSRGGQPADSFKLAGNQDLPGFPAAVAFAVEPQPGIDLPGDIGIQGIDGHRDVIHADLQQAIDRVGQHQPVG